MHRLIFLKLTSPSGETTIFSDGLGTVVTEMSPTRIKLDLFFGVKVMYVRGDVADVPLIAVQPTTVTTTETLYDKVRALKSLMDDGVITKEDFEAKKGELLAAM
jgi:hypothetical protein